MNRACLIAAAALLAGCGSIFDMSCDSDMDDARAEFGAPQEVTMYDSSSGYHSHTWWWWSRGMSRTFVWGGSSESCRTSDYRFRPIR